MDKPASLRSALEAALPNLKQNPENLLVFVDAGNLVCTQADNFSFEYQYTLNMIVTEYSKHPNTVFVPMLVWIRENQPNLLTGNPDGGMSFEAEIIKHDVVDLEIKLKLSERVIVTKDGEKLIAAHAAEPKLPDLSGSIGWDMYANGEVVQATPLADE